MTIESSSFVSVADTGLDLTQTLAVPVVRNNVFDTGGGAAMWLSAVEVSAVALSGAERNQIVGVGPACGCLCGVRRWRRGRRGRWIRLPGRYCRRTP